MNNFFIGIVPPEPIYSQVLDIQKQFGDNRTEPHITLRAPVIPTNVDGWISAVETVASGFDSFTIELPATGNFGARVLFIEARSAALYELHALLTPAIKPFEPPGKKEQDFHAHLTLGRLNVGFSKRDLAEMKALADKLVSNPLNFEVERLRIYYKPFIHERYKVYRDVQLKQ